MPKISPSVEEDISELKKSVLSSFINASIDLENNKNLPPGVQDGSIIDDAFNIKHGKTIFTVKYNGKNVGGIIVKINDDMHNYLHTLWLTSEVQNKGFGQIVIEFIENKYLNTISWSLETPKNATRNIYFYKKKRKFLASTPIFP